MSYISFKLKKQQTCPSCKNSLITTQNTQKYCQNCNYCPVLLQESVIAVPNSYKSNSQPSIPKNLQTIRSYLTKFANACGFHLGQQNLTILSIEALNLHKYKGNQFRKGYEQNCAVIIYNNYKSNHKMNIREFCKKCGVKQSKFNKFYIDYSMKKNIKNKIRRQVSQTNQNSLQHKIENLFFQSSFNQNQENQSEKISLNSLTKNILQTLYTLLFHSPIYLELRQEIINQIIHKVCQYIQKVVQISIDQYSSIKINQTQSILYMIFTIIKRAGLRISFKLYKQKVHETIGINLSNKIIRKFKNSYQKIVSDEGATIGTISTTFSVPNESRSQENQAQAQL